jgi:hypothetical protein
VECCSQLINVEDICEDCHKFVTTMPYDSLEALERLNWSLECRQLCMHVINEYTFRRNSVSTTSIANRQRGLQMIFLAEARGLVQVLCPKQGESYKGVHQLSYFD